MPYWSPLAIDGVTIDLAHLEPFEFQVMPARHTAVATVSVHFHDHCFTETFDPARHAVAIQTNQASAHELRAFNVVRYELSKSLPGIIRALDGQRVASTREGNLVRVTLQDGTTYPMFFTLRRENNRRVKMFVVSAYPWDGPGKLVTTGEMKFNLALAKVLQGQRLHFPPR
jgi:hypothetical protein